MTEHDAHDVAPEDTGEGSGLSQRKGRQAFRKITRELSDKDLANPAVQRLLLDELDRLEIENDQSRSYQRQFHETDKRVAVLEEKSKMTLGSDIVSLACLAIGAAALGYTPVLWDSQPSGWIALVFGFVLVGSGIAAKVVTR